MQLKTHELYKSTGGSNRSKPRNQLCRPGGIAMVHAQLGRLRTGAWDIQQTITNPSGIPVSPGEAPYQMGAWYSATSEAGYDPAAYELSPEMIKALSGATLKASRSK
jgi:hypothetical protein